MAKGEQRLFEKEFHRRDKNAFIAAVSGAIETVDLVMDHADDDMAVAAVRRAIPIPANCWVEIAIWIEEQWVNGGNAVALTIGDDSSATAFDNSATHQSDAVGEHTPSVLTRKFYSATDTIDMVITPATTAPSAGKTRVQVKVEKAVTVITE